MSITPGRLAAPRSPRRLIAFGLTAVAAFTAFLVIFYHVPWGGRFNRSQAGPVSEWVGDLLTAAGILGLLYQLSHMRLSRVDETTREINSLYVRTSVRPWQRNMETPGKLIYVYVQNDGERKAMDVVVDIILGDGSSMPDEWLIENHDRFPLPPSMPEAMRIALFHVPDTDEPKVFGRLGRPRVRVHWTDPWGRRVEMIDNQPSVIKET